MWQTAEVVALVVCQFIYFGVMARLLSKADYGLMAITNSIIAIGTIFAEGGLGAALIQRKNINLKHMNAALQGGVFFSSLIIGVFFLLAPLIAVIFDQPMLSPLIRVVALNFFLLSVTSVSMSLLHKKFMFRESALVTIISCVLGFGAGIVFGYLDYGVWSLVIANLLFSFLKMAGFFYFAPIKLQFRLYRKEWRQLFSFGSGMIILRISNYLGNNGLILMLGKIFIPSVLGVFERTFQIKNMPSNYLGKVLIRIMFPAMSEIQDEEERLFKVYDHGLGLSNSILMPLALYFIFFSGEIVHILLGQRWNEAILPLQIMFVVLPFSISGRMTDSVIRAKGLVYKNVSRKLIYVFILFICSGLGAWYYGLEGAAAGVTFSVVVNYLIMVYLVGSVFKRSFLDVFYVPLAQALRLTILLSIILVPYYFLFKRGGAINITAFLALSVFLCILLGLLAFKRPTWLGTYIHETLKKVKSRKKVIHNPS